MSKLAIAPAKGAKSPVGVGGCSGGALSLRGTAMLMKSITRFLAKSKSSTNTATVAAPAGRVSRCGCNCGRNTVPPPTHRRRKKMTGKDGKSKLSQRVLETAKRETHFSKAEIEALYKVYRKLITMNRPKVRQDKRSRAIGGGAVVPSVGSSGTVAGVTTSGGTGALTQSAATPANAGSGTSNPGSVVRKANIMSEGIDRTVFCELMHITFDIVTEDMLMERIFCVWDRENANLITPMSWFAGLSVFLRGTTMEHIEFCFAVYDLNVDGFITKEEMFQLLKNCLIKHPQEEDPDEGVKDFVEIVMRKLDKDKDGKVSLIDYRQSVLEEPLLLEAFGKCLPEDPARDTFLSTIRV